MPRLCFARLLLFALLVLPACRPTPTPVPAQGTPTSPPTATRAAPAATATAAPTHPAARPEATASEVESALPLAQYAWDDRTPFAVGLRPEAQAALEDLPGASVYHITLEIDSSLTRVRGWQAVRYTNTEAVTLDAVVLWLFPNLLGGAVTVSDVTVDGEPVEAELVQDGALMGVPLSPPLEPGTAVVLSLTFDVEVPSDLERNYGVLAAAEGVLALAHAYPQVAVYDDTGWNDALPSTQGDVVYADASFYLVQVTAPADLVMAGSGVAIERASQGDTQVVTYAAGPARDFYLAGSRDYAVLQQTADGVTLTSLAPARYQAHAQLALDAAAKALDLFGRRYGPYPYTEFDIVATPTLALGIEYPGMTALTFNLFEPEGAFSGTAAATVLEGTTAHEVGHQWFYNLVGSDQLDEPWLDESLVQYATWRYYEDAYGKAGGMGYGASLEARWARVDFEGIPIGLPVSEYTGAQYSAIVYGRGAFFFGALRDTLGEAAFDAFLADYVAQYSWQVATGDDLRRLAEAHCSCDLQALFAAWVYP